MGYKHTRDEILAGALATAFEDGMSRLTFGRVAGRLGINDRTVVYYFPTKDDLITDVLLAMGARLQETLAPAMAEPARDHLDLLRAAWPVLATPENDEVFALFFEATGLAASGREPYRTVVPQLVGGWIEWSATLLVGSANGDGIGGQPGDGLPDERVRVEAETAVAVVDGLLLLRQLAGPEAADRAARRLGVA